MLGNSTLLAEALSTVLLSNGSEAPYWPLLRL